MKTLIRLGDRIVGTGHPCLLVAELGINHGGSIDTALEMVRAAAKTGADCVKVQAFKAESFCTEAATYQGERQIDLFRRHELSATMLSTIAEECKRQGVIFFGTPDSLDQAKVLLSLGAPCLKVGSDDIIHLPLLRDLATLGVPMILSTGMASVLDIMCAIEVMAVNEVPTVLLHCVSSYPTPPVRANIKRMIMLDTLYDMLVGYSDHTDGIDAAVGAVWAGACVVEKHFTLDRSLPGPDQAFSADVPQFSEMAQRIRLAELMRGTGQIEPSDEEKQMRVLARRSIVASRKLFRGETIGAESLAYKRPGDGLSPALADVILGTTVARDIEAEEQFRLGDWS